MGGEIITCSKCGTERCVKKYDDPGRKECSEAKSQKVLDKIVGCKVMSSMILKYDEFPQKYENYMCTFMIKTTYKAQDDTEFDVVQFTIMDDSKVYTELLK